MKINPIANPNVLSSYKTAKAVSDKNAAAMSRDQVSFSNEALNFSKALTQAKEQLETRSPAEQARISDVTNAVRQGTYKVSSEDVAAKILESVKGNK